MHKLITIATPHLGTPIASGMLPDAVGQDPNICVRNLLATFGSVAYSSVTIEGALMHGAVADLQGNGSGVSLSPALKTLRDHSRHDVPTSLIAGVITEHNLAGLDCVFPCSAWILRKTCPSSPLAQKLTEFQWPTVFGGSSGGSDAIVPLSSQTAGLGTETPVPGLIHSAGVSAGLSFREPDELNSPEVASRVVDLLYTPTTSPAFGQRP